MRRFEFKSHCPFVEFYTKALKEDGATKLWVTGIFRGNKRDSDTYYVETSGTHNHIYDMLCERLEKDVKLYVNVVPPAYAELIWDGEHWYGEAPDFDKSKCKYGVPLEMDDYLIGIKNIFDKHGVIRAYSDDPFDGTERGHINLHPEGYDGSVSQELCEYVITHSVNPDLDDIWCSPSMYSDKYTNVSYENGVFYRVEE